MITYSRISTASTSPSKLLSSSVSFEVKKTGWENKTSFKDKIILLPGTCTSSYELTQEDVLVLHFSIY